MAPSNILVVFIAISLLDLGWTMFLMALNYREAVRHGGELPPDSPGGMNEADAAKSFEYSRARMMLAFIETPLSVFVVLALAVVGAFGWFDSRLSGAVGSAYWRGAAFLGCFFLLQALVSAPAGLYGTFVIEKTLRL